MGIFKKLQQGFNTFQGPKADKSQSPLLSPAAVLLVKLRKTIFQNFLYDKADIQWGLAASYSEGRGETAA